MKKLEIKKGASEADYMNTCIQEVLADGSATNDYDAMDICRSMYKAETEKKTLDNTVGGQESEIDSSLSGGLFVMSP